MGTSLSENNPEQKKYANAVHEYGILVFNRVLRPWLYTNITYVLTKGFWKQRMTTNILHKFSLDVIMQRKKDLPLKTTAEIQDLRFKPKKRLAMLDLLLSAKNDGFPITDEGIREEVDTFMFEVHFYKMLVLSAVVSTKHHVFCLVKHNNNTGHIHINYVAYYYMKIKSFIDTIRAVLRGGPEMRLPGVPQDGKKTEVFFWLLKYFVFITYF